MADKQSIVEKVRKLVNLASSSNKQEADRAAYMACALIRQHGLDVVDPDQIDQIYEEQAQLKQSLEDTTKQLEAQGSPSVAFGTQQVWLGTTQMQGPPLGHSAPYHSPPPRPYSPPPSPSMAAPVDLVSKYDGTCQHCKKRYVPGDLIKWQRGVGVWCQTTSCYNDWLMLQKQGGTHIVSPADDFKDLFKDLGKTMAADIDQSIFSSVFGKKKRKK